MKYFSLWFKLIIFFLISALIYFVYNSITDIAGEYPLDNSTLNLNVIDTNKKVLYIGVVSRYEPITLYHSYQPILDYLSNSTSYRFELKLSSTYHGAVEQLFNGDVAAAFIGSFIYFENRNKKPELHAILAPNNSDGKPIFQSVVVTQMEKNINSIADFPGQRLALPSPSSFSGVWPLRYLLPQNDFNVSQFAEVKHFKHHVTVIREILKGKYDIGVVKESILSAFSKQIKIIKRSPFIPSSPLVISGDLASKVAEQIKTALLKVNSKNKNFNEIIKSWDKEFKYGFSAVKDEDYDCLAKIVNLNGGN